MPLTIDEVFLFIATEDDGEGIPAMQVGRMMMPLVGADRTRVASLRQMAQQVADESGCTLTLARFTTRDNLETITPKARS